MENKELIIPSTITQKLELSKIDKELYKLEVANMIYDNPKLVEIMKTNEGRESIYMGLLTIMKLGLNVSKVDGLAYIIPYGNKAQTQIAYKGFNQLVFKTGNVRDIFVNEFYKGDTIKKQENGLLSVETAPENYFNDNKELIGFLGTILLKDGTFRNITKTKKEIEDFRDKFSKSASNPDSIWKKHFIEMSRKTIIKQLIRLVKEKIDSGDLKIALESDQAIINNEGKPEYLDNPNQVPRKEFRQEFKVREEKSKQELEQDIGQEELDKAMGEVKGEN